MNTQITRAVEMKIASQSDAKNRQHLKTLESILWDRYCIGREITFEDLAVEFSNATSLNWRNNSALYTALNELNRRSREYIFSACVVRSGGMPARGFFAEAEKRGLIKPGAPTRSKMLCWMGQFDALVALAQEP